MSDIEHLDEGEGSEPSDAIEIEYSDEDELSEEGEKLDTYEKDDFLVADDELSDSEQQSRPKKTKRLKSARDMEQQKAEVEEELKDLVDSELEDEDAEPLPTKHAAIEPTSDASDADEELDSDVEHDRANLALVSQIFAIDVEEETPASPEKSMLRHFEHAQLKEIYATEEQKQVRRKDIPERLQVIFKGREFPDKTELDQEAEWLFSRIVLHSSSLDRPEVKTKIRHFLDCYRVSKYEIPFIGTYRKHFFEPDLKVSWLRDLARWDMDWGFVYGSKLKQATLLTKMQEAGVDIPEEINILLGTTHPTDFRHEISDLDAFIDNFAPPGSMDTAFKKSSMFKTQSFDQIRQRYGRIAEEAALSPFELNFNVKMNERRYTPGICLQRPTELAFEYIDKPDEEGRILDDVANMMRQDLHSMPSIRRDVRDEYLKRAKVFTTPTEKGKIMLDIFHPLYRTKNLELGKPVTSFDDDLWILIESAEQQSLITVSFRVVNESQTDDILEKLKEVYLSDETEEDEVIHEWNAYRTEILFHLVRQLYSTLEKHLRSEFHIKAEQYIAEKCASKFERLLKHVPFTSEEEEEQRPRVLAFVTDTEVESFGQTVMIALNSYGEVVDSKTLGFLSMRRTENRATIDQRKFEEDKTIIQRTALEFRPNLIVVGANCLAATIVRINLQRDIIKQITQDGFREDQVSFTLDSANWLHPCPLTIMGDMDIPKIFSNSYRAKKILPNYDEQFLQAISLARYYQDPPAELLGLWADPNQISVLQLNLHEFQSKVSDSVLLQHLEAIVVDHVSYTGIDLNLVKDHAHLRSPLQFVPGLGPVKAFALIDRILKRGEPITMRYDIATRYNKIITTVVYENSIAYIRLSNRAYAEEREELDTTRIHPEHYELARHVASSALDLDPNDETSIEEIMKKKNLDQLSNLDLKSYAAELNETGQSGESKTNYELLLNFICDEFRRPFRISRDSFREMKPTDALYKCSGEMPTTLAEGLIVNAVILKGQAPEKPDDIVTCRLESGLVAQFESSGYRDADVKEFFRGQQVVGRVKKIAVDYRQEGQLQYRINLSAEPSDLADHKRFVSDSMLDPAFKIDENDWIDKSNIEESKAAGQKYVPRRVNHPKYKNIGFETACSFLHSKEVGDLVFRPSSRGQDHLTCTWKFFEGIYSHLDIIEEGKPALNMLGSQFHIREESYDSLQEIADRYVLNCEKLVKEVIAHPRFLFHPRGLEAVEAELRQLKRQQPQKIHYLLTVSPQYPQFFILLYIPKDDVKHEYMKVKPKGLYFHELFHQSIHYLLTWFKKHYTTSSYQKDLKATRAPHMDCTPNFAIPGRFRPTGRMTPSREDASGTPSRYRPSRGYESPGPDVERPRHRSRRPPDRSGGIKRGCYKCGDPDHMARDCPQGDDAGGDRRPRERDSRPRACYNCGEEGHISRDCPRERNERSDRRGGDRGSGRSGDRGGDRDHRRSRDHSEPPVEERWTSTPAAIFDEPVGPTVWSDPSAQPEEPTGWNTTPRVPEATEEPNPWPINN